jgi:hypothetical protein
VGQAGEITDDLFLGITPGKIGVRLREPPLGEVVHDFGAGKGLGKEEHVGVCLLHFVNEPFPEPEGLGVWVVDAEDAHPLLDPEHDNTLQLLPECLPMLGFKL